MVKSTQPGWSEERLLRWLRTTDRPAAGGVRLASLGHDAAVVRQPRGRPVLCVDQTVAGVHFDAKAGPAHIGAKAVGRVLSDLAATAARPRALLLALRAPAATSEAWMRAVIRAVRRRAGDFDAELIGGDLAAAPGPVALTVTAYGELSGKRRAPGRDRARPGQLVLLTGPVGGSALGRHLRIEPRIAAGAWLHARGATAMMDVSDGLARDLARIAAMSSVAIDVLDVPIHAAARKLARTDATSALSHALNDGEDHELIATMAVGRARRAVAGDVPGCPRLSVIGRVRAGAGLRVPREGHAGELIPWSGRGGWIHGGTP